MVRFSCVDAAYSDRFVLKHFNLDLSAPGHHVLMGASGGGKSTLLKAIIAAYLKKREVDLPQWSGTIDLKEGLHISYLPQECGLAPWLTVRQNIILGRQLREARTVREMGATGERATAALRLEPWLDSVPSQLSVGTARRVALTRALVTEPDLILLDEPFSGLDFDLREDAIQLLLSEFRDPARSILMVTHEPYEAAAIATSAHILSKTFGAPVTTLQRLPHEDAATFETRIREALFAAFREPTIQ